MKIYAGSNAASDAEFGATVRVGLDSASKSAVRISSGVVTVGPTGDANFTVGTSGAVTAKRITVEDFVDADYYAYQNIVIHCDEVDELGQYFVHYKKGGTSYYALILNGSRGGQSAGMIRIHAAGANLAYPIGMIIPPGLKGGHTITIETDSTIWYARDVGVSSSTLEAAAVGGETQNDSNHDSLQFGTLSSTFASATDRFTFYSDPDDTVGGTSRGVGGDAWWSWDDKSGYSNLGRQSTGGRYTWVRSYYDFRLMGTNSYFDFAPLFNTGLTTKTGGITVKDAQGARDNATYDLKVNGSIGATSNITAYVSDERLKENIKTIDSGLEIIDKVRPIEFDWNDKSKEIGFEPENEHEFGFSAQQLQEVFPDAVAPSPINKGGTDMDYLTVQPEKLIPLLVGAVKEQSVQIDGLKERIKKLENE
jgi:hypothetical protein